MKRFLLALALGPTLSFALVIGVIVTRPYDEGQVRALLTPPAECPMPCWMGIRPGVTTFIETMSILEKHPWVGEIEVDAQLWDNPLRGGFVYWQWSGEQPAEIDGYSRGFLVVANNVVRRVVIRTTIPFGALWLYLDRPESGLLGRGPLGLWQRAAYEDGMLWAESHLPCPLRLHAFWAAPVILKLYDVRQPDNTVYDLRQWLRRPQDCA